MPPNRSDRGDAGDWVPIAAGVVVGVGVLALIYKMFFSGCRGAKCSQVNQQIGAPFKCTCNEKNAKCKLHANAAEEARRLAAETKGKGGGRGGRNNTARAVPVRRRSEPSTSEGSGVPWGPVIGGTALMALLVFLAKTGTDPDGWAGPIHAFIQRLRESAAGAYGEEECEPWPEDEKEGKK